MYFIYVYSTCRKFYNNTKSTYSGIKFVDYYTVWCYGSVNKYAYNKCLFLCIFLFIIK